MTLADLTRHAGEWLRGAGPMHDVVISSRVRLARNLAGMPFLARCNDTQKQEILDRLKGEILQAGVASKVFCVDVDAASDLDRALLVERHLISQPLARADHPRGVAISEDETAAIMVNEEDHLRLQVLRSALQLNEAFEEINRIDDLLEQRVDFAFSSRFGYLTACPTNVGTGLRVSVMLHLPALKLSGEIDRAFRAARDMRLAIRGLYGEGTEAMGDFFQVSNQVTLGRSEQQIVDDFVNDIVPHFLQYERRAREQLLKNNRTEIDDKVFRAVAVLRAARRISSEETLYLLSLARLGVNLERVRDIELKTLNELFLLTQPAHLQKIHGRTLDAPRRAEVRAEFIRRRLGGE
jgi:protein arginine kinase